MFGSKQTWDGKSPIDHELAVKMTLLHFITPEERELAAHTSYGDLGRKLKKSHGSRFHGGSYDKCIVQSDIKTITVSVDNAKYEMTWNKAAKAIHRWVHEEAEKQ